MYLYATYNDPIQMISGDAYADIEAVKPHYTIPIRKEEPKSPSSTTDEIFELYLVSKGSAYVREKTGMSSSGFYYRATVLGYRYVGTTSSGHWEAPRREGSN